MDVFSEGEFKLTIVFVGEFVVVEHFDFDFAEEVFDDGVVVTGGFIRHGLDDVVVF